MKKAMADVLHSSSANTKLQTTIWMARIIFFCLGVASTFHLLRLAVPYSVNLLRSALPGLWLYIVVNFIILTVAASSIFNQNHHHDVTTPETGSNHEANYPAFQKKSAQDHKAGMVTVEEDEEEGADREPYNYGPAPVSRDHEEASPTSSETWLGMTNSDDDNQESDQQVPKLMSSLDHQETAATPPEELMISTSTEVLVQIKQSPSDYPEQYDIQASGREAEDEEMMNNSTNSTNSKGPEDMEATWKAITARKPQPQLRKSGTWTAPARSRLEVDQVGPEYLKKWDTFNSIRPRGSGPWSGPRREPSMGQEELNTRVEAFIRTFNERLRLQRQESDQRYLDMVHQSIGF